MPGIGSRRGVRVHFSAKVTPRFPQEQAATTIVRSIQPCSEPVAASGAVGVVALREGARVKFGFKPAHTMGTHLDAAPRAPRAAPPVFLFLFITLPGGSVRGRPRAPWVTTLMLDAP